METFPEFSTCRRKQIVPVRISVTDAAVATVNEKLAALVAGDLAPRIYRVLLRAVNGRCTLTTGTAYCPSIVMENNMLVALAHHNLLIVKHFI